MKKLLPYLLAVSIGVFLSSCGPTHRVVENPLIETANTRTLDIVKVELSDTATVLHVEAYFRPRWWIRIVKETYLQANGKKYPMLSAEGFTPDSLFWMPDSGRASFRIKFGPLPRRTKSFDFIESDCADCFKLYGVDLTGKTKYDEFPEGLPKELRKAPKDGPVPDALLGVGETTVNVHLLGFRQGLFQEVRMYVNTLFNGQQEYVAEIDSLTGVATIRFEQYGPANAYMGGVGPNVAFGWVWIAPGETTDMYVDLRSLGKQLVERRDSGETRQYNVSIYSTGTYGALTMLLNRDMSPRYGLSLYSGDFADYKMSADEYTQMLVSKYRSHADSIAASGMGEMMKEHSLLSLQQQTLGAITNARNLLIHNYRSVHDLWGSRGAKIDYEFATFGPEHYAAICELFDVNNPKLLLGSDVDEYVDAVANREADLAHVAGITEGFMADFSKVASLPTKAENNSLTQEDLDVLHSLKAPFYAEACEAIQARVSRELAAVEGKAVIEPAPDVSDAKLFDAIIAPYKGKVILVDFWNTWCGPCRMSIKENEPLKTGELKSDDLVWIYIANETSPLVTYKTSIAKIAGKHYRLNDKQWRYLCEKFKIDGIPSYVVVDKDGSYRLRNDLRDHSALKRALKKMIE